MIQPLAWDDLILDASVVRLVREDFRLFLEREEWYKRHRLPFAGDISSTDLPNGKSSAIRAMLSASGVSGFMLNPFRSFDEDILGAMFKEASESTQPSSCWRISIAAIVRQRTGAGIANTSSATSQSSGRCGKSGWSCRGGNGKRSSILDSAILRRPGALIALSGLRTAGGTQATIFPAHVRRPGIRRHHGVRPHDSELLVRQLREAYILAGQIALEEDGEINASRLVRAICTLTETMMAADRKWNSPVGFKRLYRICGQRLVPKTGRHFENAWVSQGNLIRSQSLPGDALNIAALVVLD